MCYNSTGERKRKKEIKQRKKNGRYTPTQSHTHLLISLSISSFVNGRQEEAEEAEEEAEEAEEKRKK